VRVARPAALLLLLCGCFQYLPSTPAGNPAGVEVRVGLTPAGSRELAPVIGSSVTAVEGRLVETSGDTLTLRVSRLLTAAGVPVSWSSAPVRIPGTAVASVERQALARGRTAVVVAAVAALGVLAWRALRPARGGRVEPGPGPGPIF